MRSRYVPLFLLMCASLFVNLCPNAFAKTALTCKFSPLPLPGNFNTASGVNDAGFIVGDILIGNSPAQGFLLSATGANFFSISGATQTIPADINNVGEIVGSYTDAESVNHGFLHDATGFHTIDYPGQTQNPSTSASGINDQGTIVGTFGIYYGPGSTQNSYLLQAGMFTEIAFPNAVITDAAGINNEGEIVGAYATLNSDNSPVFHGFYWREGRFTTVDYPGASSTGLNGINDSGTATGIYADATGKNHPFVFKADRFFPISVPPTDTVQIYGVNNKNEIVGLDIAPDGSIKSNRAYCPSL
ncbi:MAG TPA: hypothetical protein VGM18_03745 [Candidatus Sulfotelmatobacter sp.]